MNVKVKDREKTHTPHGNVSYDVVKCCSCENMVAEESTTRVFVGDPDKVRYRTDRVEVRFKSTDYVNGYLCEYCRDDPARYPNDRVFRFLSSTKVLVTLLIATYLLVHVL